MQKASPLPSPPILKRGRLAVCFSGGSCTAAVGAGEKSALGLSPGHLVNPVDLQMPGSPLVKGWGFGGSGWVSPLTINNQTEEQLCKRE